MLVVGLTGGICSGKTTVLKIFKKLGLRTIDADEIAHQLTKPGRKILKKIVGKFGKEILDKNGRLERKKLAEIIFKDKKKRKQLNGITHPEIIAEIKRKIREFQKLERKTVTGKGEMKEEIVIVDIPLLFEAKLEHLVDKIVLVYVPQRIQMERLMRDDNLTFKEAKARIDAQIPLHRKKKYAHYIINGNLNFSKLRKQVESVYKEWQKIIAKDSDLC
jgi:dephospho-CoA kinase